MLQRITTLTDPLIGLVKDDPVRPEIPSANRVHDHADIFVWFRDDRPAAVTCVRYCDHVPVDVPDMISQSPHVAVFYTIWSYAAGAGRELIEAAQRWIIEESGRSIDRYVTLSPKTEMAQRFHHRNGAVTLQENANTVNYEYVIRNTVLTV